MADTTTSVEQKNDASSQLLLYTAIGLATILLALTAFWFIGGNNEEPAAMISDAAAGETMVENTMTDNPAIVPADIDPISAPVQLDNHADSKKMESLTIVQPIVTVATATQPTQATEMLLSEIRDLQQQLAQAHADNQTLIKQVQTLSSANNQQSATQTETERHHIPLSNIVRNDSPPDFSKKARPNPANVELAPKWGNMTHLSSSQGS